MVLPDAREAAGPSLPKAALAICGGPLCLSHLWLWPYVQASIFLFPSKVSLFFLLSRLHPLGSYLTLAHLIPHI